MVNLDLRNKSNESESIPAWASKLLSKDDCHKIEEAVRAAESKTSGEIIPMLVHSSVSLRASRWILFISLMLVLAFGLNFFETHFYSWQYIAAELGFGIMAALISFMVPLHSECLRFLLPNSDVQRLVEQRAELEFYRLGINGTNRRSGILIFVSLAEHRAVVLADKVIADKLPANTWNEVLTVLLSGIKVGRAGQGYIDAVNHSAKILAEHFPEIVSDENELSNRLVIKE